MSTQRPTTERTYAGRFEIFDNRTRKTWGATVTAETERDALILLIRQAMAYGQLSNEDIWPPVARTA